MITAQNVHPNAVGSGGDDLDVIDVDLAVLSELDAARQTWSASNPTTPLTSTTFPEFLRDASLPILTSCIQESLRLRSSSFSIRRIGVATEFAGYRFDAGDQVVCNTRAVHMDERVYERAAEFLYDRFTEEGKKRIHDLDEWEPIYMLTGWR